jgi:hypothetical protein
MTFTGVHSRPYTMAATGVHYRQPTTCHDIHWCPLQTLYPTLWQSQVSTTDNQPHAMTFIGVHCRPSTSDPWHPPAFTADPLPYTMAVTGVHYRQPTTCHDIHWCPLQTLYPTSWQLQVSTTDNQPHAMTFIGVHCRTSTSDLWHPPAFSADPLLYTSHRHTVHLNYL